jgi:hypothetical protein
MTVHAASATHLTLQEGSTEAVDRLMNILSTASVEVYDAQHIEVEMESWQETIEAVLEDRELKHEIIQNIEAVFTKLPTHRQGSIFRGRTKQLFPHHCQLSLTYGITEVS